MGKAQSSSNLLLPCFGLSALWLATTWPSLPAWHRSTAVQAACCWYRGGRGGGQLSKKPHYFAHLSLINLCLYFYTTTKISWFISQNRIISHTCFPPFSPPPPPPSPPARWTAGRCRWWSDIAAYPQQQQYCCPPAHTKTHRGREWAVGKHLGEAAEESKQEGRGKPRKTEELKLRKLPKVKRRKLQKVSRESSM